MVIGLLSACTTSSLTYGGSLVSDHRLANSKGCIQCVSRQTNTGQYKL